MLKRTVAFLAAMSVAFLAFSGFGPLFRPSPRGEGALPAPGSVPRAVGDLSNAAAIRLFEERIERNPADAVSYTILGQLHISRARETGDVSSYQRAETALQRALELLPNYTPAAASLGAAFYAEHRFTDALEQARQVYEGDSKATQALATMGDAYLALGQYREAERAYQELALAGSNPAILARLAQLEWLRGNAEWALELMQGAASRELQSGRTGEAVAWYQVRLGDLHFAGGRLEEAAAHYEAAFDLFDGYYLALAGLGKVRAAEGRYDEAIDLYEQAVAVIPLPATLAALGDLYAKIGETAQARLQYDTVEAIAKLQAFNRQLYNRRLVLFYADHDLKVSEALELACNELDVRKDIYGYDVLAWALHKNGRHREAADAIEQAMRLGTRDAALYYHAGMIQAGLGDNDQAQELLTEALAINPHFDPLQAELAQATLVRLGAGVEGEGASS
ncbi:MAG: tetratricopeptide repeat protein [Acidimicrobiia bacterium]